MKKLFFLSAVFISATAFAQKAPAPKPKAGANTVKIPPAAAVSNENSRVAITTAFGEIIVKLYDSTPIHRDNFLKLADAGFYDSLLFHRVMPAFMIQGGDPSSKNALPGEMLGGGGDNSNRLPAEILPQYFHKKGALAAARDGNPDKKSSTQQFYIVDGRTFSDEELDAIEKRFTITFTPLQRETYKTTGGSPFLDNNYTVFGEVESGWDVVTKIASLPRNQANRPETDVRMFIKRVPKQATR